MSTPAFDDVMIDIESMSLHPHNSLILSIGMIEFDPTSPDGLQLGERTLILPSIEQQLLFGREVSASTQKFWSAQPSAAWEHWHNYSGERRSMAGACQDITRFLVNAKRVWANHIMFDLSNIVGLFAQVGEPTPWNHRAPYDMPSFCNEHPLTNGNWHQGKDEDASDPRWLPGDLIPHHPVDDSIRQAYKVWEHWPA